MSVFIDRAFLLRVSPKLHKFTQKKQDLFNFRCPLCGDSQKNKVKARGYVYRKHNNYFFMCHNCGASTSFYNFLEKVDSTLVKEYALERYKNEDSGNINYKKPDFTEFKKTPVPNFKKRLDIPSIDSLPEEHFAKTYVLSRKLPAESFKELYYAEDFKAFVDGLGFNQLGQERLIEGDKRLVIPFYDRDKNLIAFQGRALGGSKLRYITMKLDVDNHKVFGLDRIDMEQPIYVTEGPIDSLFIKNAVATADSNLESIVNYLDKSKVILLFDNEPRNKEICKKLEKAIDNHFNVVIWPEYIEEKDINDMVLAGFSPEEIQYMIDKNTFVNLRAKMEFIKWKKI
jgi:transcription elongation factor Elf1/5S rRNA maturation endonuclease (ribonuclease M5)